MTKDTIFLVVNKCYYFAGVFLRTQSWGKKCVFVIPRNFGSVFGFF